MSTHDPSNRDDTQPRIVSHRLQVTGGAPRGPHARASGNGSTARMAARHIDRQVHLPQVILVDRDVDALREVAVALREQFDFHVTISGHEALNLLQTGTIDAIVVGQTLYSSTGLNVLAEARRRAPHTQRVLLANAAEATDIDRIAGPAQPFRILERPCTPQKLLDMLETSEEPSAAPSATPRKPEPAFTPTYHGDYEHVVLETPAPRRRTARHPIPMETAETLPIVVYTDNGDFYHAICAALQDSHDIRLATQLSNLVELAETGACPILITDRAADQTELQRITIAVRASEPALVTIASGSPNDGLALRKLINTPALFSFLPKPLSAPLVRLTVESAQRHYRDAKAPAALAPAPAPRSVSPPGATQTAPRPVYQPLQSFEQNFDIEDRFDYRRFIPYAGIAAAAVAVLVAGAWFWQKHSQANADLAVMIESELQQAERAYASGDYVQPENANALHFYRRVLEREPDHVQALQGIDSIAERLVDQVERELTADQLDAAAQSLALLNELRPGHKRLAFLTGQVNKAKTYRESQKLAQQAAEMARVEAAKANAAQARFVESRISDAQAPTMISNNAQRTQAVTRWLATARQRLAQGRLLTPPDDSAEHYFRLAERADPNNAAVDQGLREIGARLLSEAQTALGRQQIDVARRQVTDAMRFGADTAQIQKIQSDIEAAVNSNVRANFLRLALQRTRENALFEPAQDNAKFYLGQLQRLDASGPETQQATQAIALKLLDNANSATAQRQFNIAVRLIDEARRLGFSGRELQDAESRLALTRNPPPSTPQPTSTPPRVIRSAPLKYPEDAQAAGVTGWVDVGFKINADGDVYDAVAMASNPPGRYALKFERAAVAAISQYKFERRPLTDTQTQSMVMRVQFKLQ